MANYQNNMRYGRQMNPNNNRRNMPGNNNSGCGNMPSGSRMSDNNRRPESMPDEGCHNCRPESEGCHTQNPCKNDCNAGTRNSMETHPPMRNRNSMEMRHPMGNRNSMEMRPPMEGRNRMEECPSDCEKPKHRHCECRYDALEDFALAMAYVPWQRWQNLFDPCKALQCGTIFEELFKPFHGKGGCNR